MHPYIPYLLKDIADAHPSEKKEGEYLPTTFEEEMEEAERYALEDPPHTLSYYCGLKLQDFPPEEQLTEEDMKQVCEAFKDMLYSWNLSISLPENLPVPFAYRLMIETLNKKTFIPKCGFITFDFCTGYAPECELKEYCPCLKYWK